jgi:hypothetical protein
MPSAVAGFPRCSACGSILVIYVCSGVDDQGEWETLECEACGNVCLRKGGDMAKGKVTQKDRVLAYVKDNGSITRLQAANDIGCFELASRIGELEAEGLEFVRERLSGRNRYGDKVHWTKYSLKK